MSHQEVGLYLILGFSLAGWLTYPWIRNLIAREQAKRKRQP